MRTFAQRIRDIRRGLVQRYGTADAKRQLWDTEFARSRWSNLDSTPGDFLYPILCKYSAGGSILDLGCGSGNTACEVGAAAYARYRGVDISEEALSKARRRAREQGIAPKTEYLQGDVLSYDCEDSFDVILLRDSIYYIPPRRVPSVLKRYIGCLSQSGVFIVRMYDSRGKYSVLVDLIEKTFDVIERASDVSSAVVIVFRPGSALSRASMSLEP